MKRCFVMTLLLCTINLIAQYKVQFVFKKLPGYHKQTDKVYIAGSFNGWNPKNEKFSSVNTNGKSGIIIDLPGGMHEYKFTHGGWENGESGDSAMPTQNRVLKLESDTTVSIEIEHWADHFHKQPKQSTASKNVRILDSAFYIPQLKRHRRVWVYLPESYRTSTTKYPVLYMQDGQNIFDNATSAFGEWGVDEALDTLSKIHGETIVVAIDNGGEKRIAEYSPHSVTANSQTIKAEGNAYVDFLTKTLMPYINKKLRTKKQARYTSVAGSSMGGLISLYAVLKYPKKFGTAGVFSPALWLAPQLKNYAAEKASKFKGRIYFYAGGEESKTMVPDMLSVFETMRTHSKAKLQSHIRAEGKHSESTWRDEFPIFYKWLMEEK